MRDDFRERFGFTPIFRPVRSVNACADGDQLLPVKTEAVAGVESDPSNKTFRGEDRRTAGDGRESFELPTDAKGTVLRLA